MFAPVVGRRCLRPIQSLDRAPAGRVFGAPSRWTRSTSMLIPAMACAASKCSVHAATVIWGMFLKTARSRLACATVSIRPRSILSRPKINWPAPRWAFSTLVIGGALKSKCSAFYVVFFGGSSQFQAIFLPLKISLRKNYRCDNMFFAASSFKLNLLIRSTNLSKLRLYYS